MIRILHIVGDSKFGGASFGILRLATLWRSVGWHVDVLATDPEFRRKAAEYDVPVIAEDVIWREIRPWKDLRGLIRLVGLLRKGGYTIVHTHTTKAGFVGRIAAYLAGVPVVLHTVHGFAFHEASKPSKIRFYVALERLASLCCSKVITVSQFHKLWGAQLGICRPEKLIAIPNGIPEPRSVSPERIRQIRSQWGVREAEVVLLTHGRLAAEKGLEDLIDALAILQPKRLPLRLYFLGDGPLRGDLESRVRQRGLADEVHFLGFHHNVPDLLPAGDIVVLPTWREGLSIALLEAMSQGRAILTTTIGSNKEATKEGCAACLVPPQRPDLLAGAIEFLTSCPEQRIRLGTRARETYLERYTLNRMLHAYHHLYLSCLKEIESAQPFSAVLPSHDR